MPLARVLLEATSRYRVTLRGRSDRPRREPKALIQPMKELTWQAKRENDRSHSGGSVRVDPFQKATDTFREGHVWNEIQQCISFADICKSGADITEAELARH